MDTSTWKTVTGPNGTLSVRIPADWKVILTPGGFDGKTGDAITAFGTADDRSSSSIKVDLATTPFDVPLGPSIQPFRTDDLDPGPAQWADKLLAFQFATPSGGPDEGGISIAPHQTRAGPGGWFATGAAGVAFPATASEVATAAAIIRSVTIQP